MKPAINQVFREISSDFHYKIVGHSEKCESVFAIRIKNRQPIGMPKKFESDHFSNLQTFRQLDFDPFKVDKREEDITDAERRIRDARVSVIKPLLEDPRIFDPVWRSKEINFISMKTEGLKRTAIFTLILNAWAFGPDDNALLPAFEKCGGPGKRKKMNDEPIGPVDNVPKKRSTLTPTDIEKIQKGFKKHYGKNSKNSLRSAHIDFKVDEKYKDGEAPTLKQFIYWGRLTNDAYSIIAERAGKVKEQKDLRTLNGTARDNVFGPCSEIMIDSTIDNVRVVQMSNPERYIGRLTIYLCVDVYSAMVTGVYITPEHASYSTASLCIINMTENKVEFCKRYGIDITLDEWPCHFLPGRLLADRGELLSNMSSTLTSNLGIDVSNTERFRGDRKSYAEKQFHLLQLKLKGLISTNNGLVDKNDEPRITQDSRKKAVLNMNDVMKLVIHEILFYNKNHWMADYPMTPEMRAEINEPTPMNIFNYGVSKGLGNLRRLDKHVIWRNCMPRRNGVVSKEGITVKPHHYIVANRDDEKVINQIRFGGNNKCEVAFHPSYFKDSYLLHEDIFYPLKLRGEIEYLNYFEFEDFVQDLSERKKLHDREVENDEVKKRGHQRKIIESAQKRRAKKIILNRTQESRTEEIETQKEMVMTDMQSPEDKLQHAGEKSRFQVTHNPTSPLPSLINDLQKLKI